MSTSSAFLALFFAVQLPILQARNTAFGLTKLAAAACLHAMHSTETAKGGKHKLLESRNHLQTATLVFPRPIVCSRLSNINILAKKIARPPTGGMAPGPGLDPPLHQHCACRFIVKKLGCATRGGIAEWSSLNTPLVDMCFISYVVWGWRNDLCMATRSSNLFLALHCSVLWCDVTLWLSAK